MDMYGETLPSIGAFLFLNPVRALFILVAALVFGGRWLLRK